MRVCLLHDDSTLKPAAIRVVVIVIAARAGVRESEGGLRLTRLQEADVRNRRTVGMCGMRIRFHIVRTGGVIGERYALTDRDGDLIGADRAIRPDRDRGADRTHRTRRSHDRRRSAASSSW